MGKTTHSLLDIEGLMSELYNKLKDPNATKKEKTEYVKKLKLLEKHFNDCNDKHINGKKYPKREDLHSDVSGLNDKQKKEVFKLIEEGFPEDKWKGRTVTLTDEHEHEFDIDLSGVSPGKNRFVFKELG